MEIFYSSYFVVVKWIKNILWFTYIEGNLNSKLDLDYYLETLQFILCGL